MTKKIILLIIIIITLMYEIKNSKSTISDTIIITDGDTIRINEKRIRLWGIDAPELKQTCFLQKENITWPCGKKAKEALIKFINNKIPKCTTINKDYYNRTVASCKIITDDNKELNLSSQMVRNGWAFDYTRYSHGQYTYEQKKAEKEQKGLWTSNFEFPWEWRKHKNTKK